MFRFFTITILTLIACGCQSSPQKNQTAHTLKINIGDEPQNLDPRKASDSKSQIIVRMLCEGLVRLNPAEKIELALAERVEISDDQKMYTFHLKKSSWSNGDPVVASDFVHAWQKMLSPDFPSSMAFLLYVVKNAKAAKDGTGALDAIGVRAMGDYTLVVELENPTPYFLDLLATPVFYPINQKVDVQNPSWAQNANTYVGNGPFQLVEWKHQDHLLVKKNEGYWDAESVKMHSIEMQMIPGEAELSLFEKGQLDWAGSPISSIPLEALHDLKKGDQLKTKEFLGTYFFRTNTARAPFNTPLMRRAFALAIDRQAIVDHVTQGNQVPATGLVPLSLKLQKAPYFQDADKQSAKQLFEEGLKELREELPEICLLYRNTERNHLIAQAVQQQWFEAFGIRVRLETMEGKVFFERVSKQDYHLAACDWVADFADPINFLEVFKYKDGSNKTLWENSRYTELLDRSMQVGDAEQRLEILAQSEQILIDEMPIIPIFYYNMLYLNQPRLKDVVVSSMGQIDFKWAEKDLE